MQFNFQDIHQRLQDAKYLYDIANINGAIQKYELIVEDIKNMINTPDDVQEFINFLRSDISSMKEEMQLYREILETEESPSDPGIESAPKPKGRTPANRSQKSNSSDSKKPRATSTSSKDSKKTSTPDAAEVPVKNEDDPLSSFDSSIAERARQTRMDVGQLSLDDVAGMEAVKNLIYENIMLQTVIPDFFTGLREPMKKFLFFGPPGCGKTFLASVVAAMSNRKLYNIQLSSLASKWRGDGEGILAAVFALARHQAPSIIIFDEMDSLMMSRDESSQHEASKRLLGQCLIELDGLAQKAQVSDVMVIATTNCPWNLDSAIIRRFPYRIYIPPCEAEGRRQLLAKLLKDTPKADDLDIDELAVLFDGYSADDIVNISKKAAMKGLQRLRSCWKNLEALTPEQRLMPVSRDDFKEVITINKPSISADSLKKFEVWKENFGAE